MALLLTTTSTAFALLPAIGRINCSTGGTLATTGELVAVATGVLGLAAWIRVLVASRAARSSLSGTLAGFIAIAVVFVFPAFATTLSLVPNPEGFRDACGETYPVALLTAATVFTALTTCLVAFLLLRSNASPVRIALVSVAALVIWGSHVLFISYSA